METFLLSLHELCCCIIYRPMIENFSYPNFRADLSPGRYTAVLTVHKEGKRERAATPKQKYYVLVNGLQAEPRGAGFPPCDPEPH